MTLYPSDDQRKTIFSAELLAELSQSIDQLAKQKKTTIVSICGGSCTGKSTQVAGGLLKELGDQCVLFDQDTFQNNQSYQSNFNETYRWDHPDNFDIEACKRALLQLKEGKDVIVPDYSFKTDEPIGERVIPAKRIILFEGLYAGYGEISGMVDFMIYVEAPFYARLVRRIYRNTLERYKGRDPGLILKGFVSSVARAHRDFVRTQAEGADLQVHMPFRFDELIARFRLMPLADTSTCDWEVHPEEGLSVGLNQSKGLFSLCYHEKKYLEFDVDRESMELLMQLDWNAS